MRLVIDSLIATMLVAMLAGLVLRERHRQSEPQKTDDNLVPFRRYLAQTDPAFNNHIKSIGRFPLVEKERPFLKPALPGRGQRRLAVGQPGTLKERCMVK
jgi:hypothetical protein